MHDKIAANMIRGMGSVMRFAHIQDNDEEKDSEKEQNKEKENRQEKKNENNSNNNDDSEDDNNSNNNDDNNNDDNSNNNDDSEDDNNNDDNKGTNNDNNNDNNNNDNNNNNNNNNSGYGVITRQQWIDVCETLLSILTTTSAVKTLWNCCYTLGMLMNNPHINTILSDRDTSLLLRSVFAQLLLLLRNSNNYKIRITAAKALGAGSVVCYTGTLYDVFKGVLLVIKYDPTKRDRPEKRNETERAKREHMLNKDERDEGKRDDKITL